MKKILNRILVAIGASMIPMLSSALTIGVNWHPNIGGPAGDVVTDLNKYGIGHIRFDAGANGGTPNGKTMAAVNAFKANGTPMSLVISTDVTYNGRQGNCLTNLQQAYQSAYNQTYSQVDILQAYATDFELDNEVSLGKNIRNSFAKTRDPNVFETVCGNSQAAALRGMADAIHAVGKAHGKALRTTLGTVGDTTPAAFLQFMKNKGVNFDVISLHQYPSNGQGLLTTDPWFGPKGLIGEMIPFGKPIQLNEINCGEIYQNGFTNVAGSASMNACIAGLDKQLDALIHSDAPIETIDFYELTDYMAYGNCPPGSAFSGQAQYAECRFGIMYDTNHPKPIMDIVEKYVKLTGPFVPIDGGTGGGTPTGNQTCVVTGKVCVDGPSTKMVSGIPVSRDCWQYNETFNCASATPVNDCAPLQARGCLPVDAKCSTYGADKKTCILQTTTMHCPDKGATVQTIASCPNQTFCTGGSCFDTGYPSDAAFAKVVAGMEGQREAGKYIDLNTLHVFKGVDSRCSKKLGGVINCCNGNSGIGSFMSDLAIISSVAGHAYQAAGSSYTYNALINSQAPDWLFDAFDTAFQEGGLHSTLVQFAAGDMSIAQFATEALPGPWTAAFLALQYSGLISCTDSDQQVAMRRSSGLCNYVGNYCDQKFLGVCLVAKETYCCYNSKLARIINEQGRAQFALNNGDAEHPICDGFTLDQLQQLDFSKFNLDEFLRDIVPTLPNYVDLKNQSNSKVTTSCYYGKGKC